MSCSRCRSIPDLFFSKTNVFVNLPTHHHVELFENALKKNQYKYKVLEEGYLIYEVNFETYIRFLNSIVFNSIEQKDVKILPLKNEETLTFSSLKHYRSLKDWTILHKGREVASIIEGERIKTLFQPIIYGKTGEIYGYEALSRGVLKDGSIMNPEKLFSWAKDMDLMFFLDRICRESSIRAASKQKIKKKIFINFVPTAIYVPSLCLQSTVKALEEENIPPEQVVFEVVESEKVVDFEHLNHILDYYKKQGVSTALDDIGSGYADNEALLQLKPDYMKIDMSIIRDIHIDERKQKLLDKFIASGKKIGSIILAEGVETMDEYRYLQTKDIDLMQGYLFGKPEEVPATVIQLTK